MAMDLNAYLRRIGLDAAEPPSLALLARIVAAHTAAIPFENLDIVLGRPIRLDIESLQAKLVNQARGGYCFEQNTLLRAALEALGFTVASTTARVLRNAPPGVVMPQTHMLLMVTLPEGVFLADVGWGNLTPTGPLHMTNPGAQPTAHEDFRLVAGDGGTRLQARLGAEWEDIYRFTGQPSFHIDHEVGNWFTSTRPGGMFTSNAIAARPVPGGRHTFFNGTVTSRDLEDRISRWRIGSEAELRDTLADCFGIELTTQEAETVFAASCRYEAGSTFRFA